MNTEQTFNEIENLLFHKREGYFPQFLIGRKQTKQAQAWCPGNRSLMTADDLVNKKSSGKHLVGYTGLSFTSQVVPQHDQERVLLSFIAFDLDQKDNEKDLITSVPEITRFFPEFWIRSSTSGKGLHLFVKFSEPQTFPDVSTAKLSIRNIENLYINSLYDKGFKVDKSGIRCYWLLGGENTWLHKSEKTINWETVKTTDSSQFTFRKDFSRKLERKANRDYICRSEFSGECLEFIDILTRKGILQNSEKLPLKLDIYVKKLYETLKNTDFEFLTSSPMKEDKAPHINGFISFNKENITIFTAADNAAVLYIPNYHFISQYI